MGLNKSNSRNGIIGFILICIVPIMCLIGEIMCIYKSTQCYWSNETSWKAEIIYTGSALSGLGAIVGWFDIEDK
jgi:hypothetical protein